MTGGHRDTRLCHANIVWPLTIQLLSYVTSCLAFWWCSIASLGPYCAGRRLYLAYRPSSSCWALPLSVCSTFRTNRFHRRRLSSQHTVSMTLPYHVPVRQELMYDAILRLPWGVLIRWMWHQPAWYPASRHIHITGVGRSTDSPRTFTVLIYPESLFLPQSGVFYITYSIILFWWQSRCGATITSCLSFIGSVLSGLAVGQLSIAVKDLTLGLTSRSEVTAPGDASKEIYSLSFPPQVKWLSPRFPRH